MISDSPYANQSVICVCICGLDGPGSNQACGHPWNSGTEGHRAEPSSLSETSALPAVTSNISPPSSNNPCRPASLLASITANPLQRRLLPLWPRGGDWVTEVRGGSPHCYQRHLSEVCGPEALRGHTHMTLGQCWGGGHRDPPLLLFNNGWFNHSNLVGCLFFCNYSEFGLMFLTSLHMRKTKLDIYFVSCCCCSST